MEKFRELSDGKPLIHRNDKDPWARICKILREQDRSDRARARAPDFPTIRQAVDRSLFHVAGQKQSKNRRSTLRMEWRGGNDHRRIFFWSPHQLVDAGIEPTADPPFREIGEACIKAETSGIADYVLKVLGKQTSLLIDDFASANIRLSELLPDVTSSVDEPKSSAEPIAEGGDLDSASERMTYYLNALKQRLNDPPQFLQPRHVGWLDPNKLYLQRNLSEMSRAQDHEGPSSGNSLESRISSHSPPISFPQQQLLERLEQPDDKSRWRIVADAGAGKSALLEYLALRLANNVTINVTSVTGRMPFIVSLADWQEEETLLQAILRSAEPLLESELSCLISESQAVVFFDGFDEVRPAEKAEKLVKRLNHELYQSPLRDCSIVLTSRSSASYLDQLRVFQQQAHCLTKLDQEGIKAFVAAYFTDKPNKGLQIRAQLVQSPAFAELLQTPLMATLACFLAEQDHEHIPSTEAELVEQSVNALFDRRKLYPEACMQVLGVLAWELFQQKRLSHARALQLIDETIAHDPWTGNIDREGRVPRDHPEAVLQTLAQRSGLIRCVPGESCRFVLETFAESLAGWYLARQDEQIIFDMFSRHAWNPAWRRALLFCQWKLWKDNPHIANSLLHWTIAERKAAKDDLLASLLILAAELLGGVRSPTEPKLQVLGEWILAEMCLLGSVPEPEQPPLEKIWYDVVKPLAGALGIRTPASRLLKILGDKANSWRMRCAAIEVVGQLEWQAAGSPLFAVILDSVGKLNFPSNSSRSE